MHPWFRTRAATLFDDHVDRGWPIDGISVQQAACAARAPCRDPRGDAFEPLLRGDVGDQRRSAAIRGHTRALVNGAKIRALPLDQIIPLGIGPCLSRAGAFLDLQRRAMLIFWGGWRVRLAMFVLFRQLAII